MPGTNCNYIEGEDLDLDNLFGFFHAEVKTNNLYFPASGLAVTLESESIL